MTLQGALVAQEPFDRSGVAEGQPLPLSRSLYSPGRLSLFHWRMPGLLINALAASPCRTGWLKAAWEFFVSVG